MGLPLLELFAVVMMWFTVWEMIFASDGPTSANSAAVARTARAVRVAARAGKAAKAAQASTRAALASSAYLATAVGRSTSSLGRSANTPLERKRSTALVDGLRERLSPGMIDLLSNSDYAEIVDTTEASAETVAEHEEHPRNPA